MTGERKGNLEASANVFSIQVRKGFRRPLGMRVWLKLEPVSRDVEFFLNQKYIKPRIWRGVAISFLIGSLQEK